MHEMTNRIDRRTIGILFLCSLVIFSSFPSNASGQEQITITNVSFDENDLVETRGDSIYLWQSGQKTLGADIETVSSERTGYYEICVESRAIPGETSDELRCRSTVLSGDTREHVVFEFDEWPSDLIGPQVVRVVVFAETLGREEQAASSVSIHVMEEEGDIDDDGLPNDREVEVGTNFSAADSDGDDLDDQLELHTYETDPLTADTDNDGLTDGAEVLVHGTDPTAPDTDGDGLEDSAEIQQHGTDPNRPDTDGDGLVDSVEIHTHQTDPTRPDTDGDGLDDFSEVQVHETNPNAVDTDGDGLSDPLEVFAYATDPSKIDSDGDGLQDGAEVYDHTTDPAQADTDGDGLADGPEVNTYEADPNRADTDGDGLVDGAEVRSFNTDPTDPDTDGDGQGDSYQVDQGTTLLSTENAAAVIVIGMVVLTASVFARRRGYSIRQGGLGRGLALIGSSISTPSEENRPKGECAEARSSKLDDAQLLTNHDRIIALLESNGGRLEQSAIVRETDWSKAKVSRILSEMDENGQVTKINVGRGNVITLPGEEPERLKRPFEAEESERVST